MKKSILNLGIFIFLIFSLIAIISCKKDKTDTKETVPTPTPIRESLEISDFYNSGCLPRNDNDKAADTIGSVILERRGNDVLFEWPDFINECTDSIVVFPFLTGDTLEIWVKAFAGFNNKCICHYDIKATIKNLKPKRYLVKTYEAIEYSGLPRTWWEVFDSVWMNL